MLKAIFLLINFISSAFGWFGNAYQEREDQFDRFLHKGNKRTNKSALNMPALKKFKCFTISEKKDVVGNYEVIIMTENNKSFLENYQFLAEIALKKAYKTKLYTPKDCTDRCTFTFCSARKEYRALCELTCLPQHIADCLLETK